MLRAMPAPMPTTQTPRIAIVTTSSSSVSPRSSCPCRDMSDLHLVEHAVHRGHQGHCDEADQQTHHDDHGGLEQRGEFLNLVVELGFVVLRGDLELVVEGAGLFADLEHL